MPQLSMRAWNWSAKGAFCSAAKSLSATAKAFSLVLPPGFAIVSPLLIGLAVKKTGRALAAWIFRASWPMLAMYCSTE
jgi:hypothetical protein